MELRAQKTKILEEVMEKETYKVAKEILDKYGSSEQQIKSKTPVKPQESGVRRRQTTTVPATPTPAPAVNTSIRHTQSFKATPSVADRSVLNDRSLMAKDSPLRPAPQAMQRRPPGPPMPRPVLPRERGFMDKFVEYLVGDGPSNRYALICKQCQSHNGMALREEFEFVCKFFKPYILFPAFRRAKLDVRNFDASVRNSKIFTQNCHFIKLAKSCCKIRKASIVI